MTSRSILVVGGAGFIGRRLVEHLSAFYDVIAPPRPELELLDASSIASALKRFRPDVVINLAAIASPSSADIRGMYEINAFGHLRLLQAVAQHSPRTSVHLASTANVYGQGAMGYGFKESDAPSPLNHYGLSKFAAELMHAQFPGMPQLHIVRPFNCIGRGQAETYIVAKLVKAFKRRTEVLELGNIDVARDFIDVRDICAMWSALLESQLAPPVANFGNGEAISLREILELLKRLTGHRPKVTSAPHLVRAADLTYQRADNAIIVELGYQRRYSLEQTLAWMLADGDEDGQT
jgi:nucleoside-diphosphate-sugar epimerase